MQLNSWCVAVETEHQVKVRFYDDEQEARLAYDAIELYAPADRRGDWFPNTTDGETIHDVRLYRSVAQG